MSNFELTIDDLEKQSGLSRKYIDRCYARFGSLLAGYRKQSPEQNKYLYDANAVAIFLQIRDLKEGQGMKLPEIRDRMTEELGRRIPAVGNGREVEEKELESSPTSSNAVDMNAIIKGMADSYERGVMSERSKVLMLTEASEAQKKREQEYKDKIASFQVTTKRRGTLLSKLESLERKWFTAKKKREIISEIRRIDSEVQIEPLQHGSSEGTEHPAGKK